MLVSLFAADKAFIDFDNAAKLVQRSIGSTASLAEASKDKPRGFLRDSDSFPSCRLLIPFRAVTNRYMLYSHL